MDLGIEVILELFSKQGLQNTFVQAAKHRNSFSSNSERIYALRNQYIKTIEEVMHFLQGKNHTLSRQICSGNFLPQAARFSQIEDMDWAFGEMGIQDKAKHLATLYLEDISDFIIECVDENFGFSRYAERLGMSANSFDDLHIQLQHAPSFIDRITLSILDKRLKIENPKCVGFSVPFPGNLYSAFRCAQFIKKHYPNVTVIMGGGFPNTELRALTDVRVFDFFDYITLDDGELPMEILLSQIQRPKQTESIQNTSLKRTFLRKNGKVVYDNTSSKKDYPQSELGTPDYTDLLIDKYISVIEVANPMHSLWSDGRWNKLTMAHGCYWGRCTFCDVSLDYIKLYEPIAAKLLVDRMEEMMSSTGHNGFHFVDEAAPPAMMRAVAIEIIKRKLTLTWWTNIRFEKSFTKDLCTLLKASGCIAVSGGLEVASKRLLSLINKGVTLEQVAQVTRNFTDAGIMVHAYLMYGFPTQTVQETIDSLEMVRQLFELGVIQSGFWHQFALTAHSPVGLNPDDYGITPQYNHISFAHNDIQFTDETGIDHDQFSYGLKKSLYNYMHGIGFDLPLHTWFENQKNGKRMPKTSIPKDFMQQCLKEQQNFNTSPSAKVMWIGETPSITVKSKTKRGVTHKMMEFTIYTNTENIAVSMEHSRGEWLQSALSKASIHAERPQTFGQLKMDFEQQLEDFELFWYSKPLQSFRENGLIILQ